MGLALISSVWGYYYAKYVVLLLLGYVIIRIDIYPLAQDTEKR